MYNSKYSKFLTIALIVIIVIIVGLLIFWGVDTLVKYNVNKDSKNGIEAFKEQTQGNSGKIDLNLPTNNTVNSVISSNTLIDPYGNLIVSDQNLISVENNGNEISDGKELLYKGFEMVGYIEINKTNIRYPILKEATKSAMEQSVGILTGVGLNKPGVTVIAGHNYRNDLFFSNNAKLAIGDKILITDNDGYTITYEIYKKYQTTPEDASYASVDTQGKREIVLTTCTDDSQNRIIVCAREV